MFNFLKANRIGAIRRVFSYTSFAQFNNNTSMSTLGVTGNYTTIRHLSGSTASPSPNGREKTLDISSWDSITAYIRAEVHDGHNRILLSMGGMVLVMLLTLGALYRQQNRLEANIASKTDITQFAANNAALAEDIAANNAALAKDIAANNAALAKDMKTLLKIQGKGGTAEEDTSGQVHASTPGTNKKDKPQGHA